MTQQHDAPDPGTPRDTPLEEETIFEVTFHVTIHIYASPGATRRDVRNYIQEYLSCLHEHAIETVVHQTRANMAHADAPPMGVSVTFKDGGDDALE